MLLLGATQRGLKLEDLDEMTLGGLISYCVEYNEAFEENDEDKPTSRKATQADINRMFKN